MRKILILVFEGAQLLDIAGPLDAFSGATEVLGQRRTRPLYRVVIASLGGRVITTGSGLQIKTEDLGKIDADLDTLIVVGGPGIVAAAKNRRLIDWVRGQANASRRICSVCTGAFLLAQAGLLSRRRVTTHWSAAAQLQAQHPDLVVDADRIFIRDGRIWTSAGVTAGIDLTLALIEQDHGRSASLAVARLLVVFAKRPGGQLQFSAALAVQTADTGQFSALHDWVREHLTHDLRVEALAERAHMSPRTFARVYAKRVGNTPARTIERLRLEAARVALEENAVSIKEIARNSGFGDEERMRRAFIRNLGLAPASYRARFCA